ELHELSNMIIDFLNNQFDFCGVKLEKIVKQRRATMSYDYSENILVQESAGNLLHNELGWDVQFAYNTETLGRENIFGRDKLAK
ncbi:MAG: hypothetical protein V8Q32_08725, partial [Anaerotignum faecicola]